MKNRLMLAISMCAFLLAGCQFNQKEIPDFKGMQSNSVHNLEFTNTFVPEKLSILGLGDSLTQGVGDELKRKGYIGRFTEEANQFKGVSTAQLVNEAKRGKRSDQLLNELKSGQIDRKIKEAGMIVMTIGGNDIMKIVKKDFFSLQVEDFEEELPKFEKRYEMILEELRKINPDSPIVLIGLYNPFSVVADDVREFDQILENWNAVLKNSATKVGNACYVPVDDLFGSSKDMVYHTDFFHPNSKGYEQMADRTLETLKTCGVSEMTNGEIDF